MKPTLILVMLFGFLIGCTNPDTPVDKNSLLGNDYRLFQDTPAWLLAKAVEAEDTGAIKSEINKNKALLRFGEPRFDQGLLQMAVSNKNYPSVKTLLKLGADPNLQDSYFGESPVISAANLLTADSSDVKFLKILLKYGGDPNAEAKGSYKHGGQTPLLVACSSGNLGFVKVLVNAGANVNAANEYGVKPLTEAVDSSNPDLVLYLLDNNVNYKVPLYKTIEGENKYITDALRHWTFYLNSEEYKKKMRIVEFLKKNGMDYWKTKIPENYLGDLSKDYLEKY
jgi:hypothetical protein